MYDPCALQSAKKKQKTGVEPATEVDPPPTPGGSVTTRTQKKALTEAQTAAKLVNVTEEEEGDGEEDEDSEEDEDGEEGDGEEEGDEDA